MRLQLKVVRWQNFLSYGNIFTEVQLDSHQKTLIVGKNGHGKSTIIEAISFALFGKPFRSVNKPQLQNTITRKNCLVELEFSIGGHEFAVRRGLNPALFEIYKNDELINQTADMRDYQEAFEKYIIRINHKTFCQIVMLGSAIFRPFMTLPAAERRNVIEDLLDMKIFTAMNQVLSKRISETEKDLAQKQKEKELVEERIVLTEKHLKELQDNNNRLIEGKNQQIATLQKEINDIKQKIEAVVDSIATLSAQLGDIDKAKKLLKQANDLDYKLQLKKEGYQSDLEFFNTNQFCPKCFQSIDAAWKEKTIHKCQERKTETEEAQQKLSEKIREFQDELVRIGVIQQAISDNNTKIRDHRRGIEFLENNIKQINKEIEKLSKDKEQIDTTQLTDWKKQKETVFQQLTSLNENRYTMGLAANLLKDSGIKSKMIKTYVPIINSLIQKHLATLDFFVEFKLDEQFKEHIKSRYRDEFTYESFSQGEKSRIDLALLFTWRELAKKRGSVDINLIIFDEIGDASMDQDGIDNFFKLLGDRKDENIILISHRGLPEDRFNRVLQVKKVKNFSKMVDNA